MQIFLLSPWLKVFAHILASGIDKPPWLFAFRFFYNLFALIPDTLSILFSLFSKLSVFYNVSVYCNIIFTFFFLSVFFSNLPFYSNLLFYSNLHFYSGVLEVSAKWLTSRIRIQWKTRYSCNWSEVRFLVWYF